jgi:hypothetical protein
MEIEFGTRASGEANKFVRSGRNADLVLAEGFSQGGDGSLRSSIRIQGANRISGTSFRPKGVLQLPQFV